MPHKFPEDDREYHRLYMQRRRAAETPEQRETRLAKARIYSRKRYNKRLKELGLGKIGQGHRRRWEQKIGKDHNYNWKI